MLQRSSVTRDVTLFLGGGGGVDAAVTVACFHGEDVGETSADDVEVPEHSNTSSAMKMNRND